MIGCALRSVATICIATVAFDESVRAQASDVSQRSDRLVAQAPTDQTDAKMVALQTAIEAKDTIAIFNLLNQTSRDQRGPMAALLVAGLFNLVVTENQNQTQASPN